MDFCQNAVQRWGSWVWLWAGRYQQWARVPTVQCALRAAHKMTDVYIYRQSEHISYEGLKTGTGALGLADHDGLSPNPNPTPPAPAPQPVRCQSLVPTGALRPDTTCLVEHLCLCAE